VHRDLKPENLLFEGNGTNLLKVIDFGTSRLYNPNEKMTQKFGTVLCLIFWFFSEILLEFVILFFLF
jgi:serine/threonine protein kinase